MKTEKKVLVLGEVNPLMQALLEKMGFSIIYERTLISDFLSTYNEPSTEYLKKVEELTYNDRHVDVIIVGNNYGVGYKKAKAIHPQMKSRTIITWNPYPMGEERCYAQQGFSFFCGVIDLQETIEGVLKKQLQSVV